MTFFSWCNYVCLNSRVAQCLGLDMSRSYCLLIMFVLSLAVAAEIAVQLLGQENVADNLYWVTFRIILFLYCNLYNLL
jgi:hypothetical protein